MKKFYKALIVTAVLLTSCAEFIYAQTLTDGPIQLQVRLRDVNVGFNETDASVAAIGFGPDEPVIRVWAQDNADLDGQGWLGGTCRDFKMGTNGATGLPGPTPAINDVLINYTYPTANVPQYYDLRVEAFEDDNPSDQLLGFCANGQLCVNDATQCCGIPILGVCVGLNEGDDKACTGNPFKTLNPYRNGPPCQWFDQGYITGTCGNDWKPGIETYWRYTKGTSCADAIDLGTITTGGTLTHFNSNECYTNTHSASPGQDVWYKFHANNAIGITASLCGVNGATFDSYLYLYSSCGAGTADTANDDACNGIQSTLAYSICNAGDYYLVVDGKAANDMGTFTLQVLDNPNFIFSVTPVKTDVSCFGSTDGQITAQVNGGTAPYTFSWSNSAGNVSSISGLAGGTYSVSVTDSKGCQASASVQISVPAQIAASATSTPVSCGGACDGTATASAQGGTPPYNYAWNSMPPQQLQTAVLLCANNYTVTITDDMGCSVTASTQVINSTTISISRDSVNNVRCNGAANGGIFITTSGGVTPYGFNWSNGGVNTEDNPNLGPGTYSVTITDQAGCSVGDTYVITEPSQLTTAVPFTFNPRCNGGADGIVNISVNGGVQPYTYLWSAPTNAVTQNLNNVAAGTHSVTVTDANGCTATATATLTTPAPWLVSVTKTDLKCFGDVNGTASVVVSGQNGSYTYFWSNFDTDSSTSGLHGGPFTVIIKDAGGCDTIATGTIAEPGTIDVSLLANEPLCADAGNGSISTTIVGGTGPFTYSWTGTGGFTSTQQNPQVGSGSYHVTVTDANGCTANESVGVNAPSVFNVSVVTVNPRCKGDSTGVVVAGTNGGTAPFKYIWSTNDSTDHIDLLKKGTYSVTVTDINGCSTSGIGSLSDPATNPESCNPPAPVYDIKVPTAFSPNNDNVNDKLVAIMFNVQKMEMRVYNRWGEEVYYNSNMQPNDGWDGILRGKDQPVGTYVWYADVIFTNGNRSNRNGSATLVR